jgi:putative membrane protein
MLAEVTEFANPWRFQRHVEVWLLMVVIIASYIYAINVIGPRAVGNGVVVTRRQITAFTVGAALMWLATDWPVHDISEEYLYSVHMVQHMTLAYFVPPLILIATPAWLFHSIFGDGRGRKVLRFFAWAPIAGVLFNLVVMVTHIPALVNQSVSNGALHYGLHVIVVLAALLMWIPVCSPDPSLRINYGGKMIYLFLMSVIPTVPAAWLTFADNAVYKQYDIAVRVWGLSVETDQQLGGAVMKTFGGIYLWSIIVVIFFRRFIRGFFAEVGYAEKPLMFSDVEAAFDKSTAPAETMPRSGE